MALSSTLRRVLGISSKSSLNIGSQFSTIRLNSTATHFNSPKLFVSGLSKDTTNENLHAAFAPFGSLREARVAIDKESGKSKGFAFVSYEKIEQAEKARKAMHTKSFEGSEIFVDPTIKFLDGFLIFDSSDKDLNSSVLQQVEYYFSDANLRNDLFLRKNMNPEGWVSIELLASFRKMRDLTKDVQLISKALKASKHVEVLGDMVRCRNHWEKWIIPEKVESTPTPGEDTMEVKSDAA